LIISAEHRFYGQSLPFSDLSTTGLVYATSRQALADFASLAKYTKQARNAANSKIVAMGGSYSGNLAAWARYVYPEVFDGSLAGLCDEVASFVLMQILSPAAWASSAPVEAKLEFPEYFQVLSKALGPVCWLYVADSAIVTHSGVLSGGNLQAKVHISLVVRPLLRPNRLYFLQVEQMYQTCAQLNVSKAAFDLQVFFYSILGSVADIVQYSDDNNNYQPFNINTMCRMLAATTSPTNLANVVRNVTEYNKVRQKIAACPPPRKALSSDTFLLCVRPIALNRHTPARLRASMIFALRHPIVTHPSEYGLGKHATNLATTKQLIQTMFIYYPWHTIRRFVMKPLASTVVSPPRESSKPTNITRAKH
jgi:hypothetical protein